MPRGLATKTLALIDAAYEVAAERQPISIRGIAYQLFARGVIPNMSTSSTARVSRALTTARERGLFPWEWIVDEHREIERPVTWADPSRYLKVVANSYNRDLWTMQPGRLIVVSEKGSIGGILRPVLEEYGVPFLVAHGFSSATVVKDLADESWNEVLTILYVGDYDPSGMFMSEVDLPKRLFRYGGGAGIQRVALTPDQLAGLPSFPVATKEGDKRYKWFVANYGQQCWELDALDPNRLRDAVEEAICDRIDWDAWERAGQVNEAEVKSLREFFDHNANLFSDWSENRFDDAP